MAVDDELVSAAIALVRSRFGSIPWSGAAAMRLDDDSILTSASPDTVNDAVSLCHETGALCEAFKLGRQIVESVCVTQRSPDQFVVLTPCGVCQERLFLYGATVEVGVGAPVGTWQSLRLGQVQPHHWRNGLPGG